MYDPCMECLGAKGYVYVMPDGRISFTSPCGIGGKATTQVPPEGEVNDDEFEVVGYEIH